VDKSTASPHQKRSRAIEPRRGAAFSAWPTGAAEPRKATRAEERRGSLLGGKEGLRAGQLDHNQAPHQRQELKSKSKSGFLVGCVATINASEDPKPAERTQTARAKAGSREGESLSHRRKNRTGRP